MVGLILSSLSFDDTEESIGYDDQVITYHSDSFNGTWFLVFSWKMLHVRKKNLFCNFVDFH